MSPAKQLLGIKSSEKCVIAFLFIFEKSIILNTEGYIKYDFDGSANYEGREHDIAETWFMWFLSISNAGIML